ncbi:hypothetical protein [Paenibacillus xanthanilyticus]|uniref:IDEAL domain-containing protein n=1 Tax=Paenibacillus xanthanilyticus TaxID=1783531 RepID=A0ABV8KCF4_9BACL
MLEREYYMIDMPALLVALSQREAERNLMALQIATVSQCGDADAYERFVSALTESAGVNEAKADDEFDRGAFERLRGKIG